ncbi:MAG: hypothetical protein F6K30_04375 [Cyanothece sp. SIO2G6]|nr:hypothetical protein [Cyanothece sp. SIO2G6]
MNSSASSSDKRIDVSDYDLFAFGDSLSDIGRLFSLTQGLIPPSPPYFEGRASNGPVAVEILANQLGVNHSLATNFATSGALTSQENNLDTNLIQFGGLLTQIEQFTQQADALGADANDLYFIWAGGNDFQELAQNPNLDVELAVAQAVANIATAVTSLAELGAQDIVVALSPNIGRAPSLSQTVPLDISTTITIAFNTVLTDTLTDLEASLGGTNLVLVDLFTIGEAIAQNPADFGFTNIEDAYLSESPPVDPNTYLYWDDLHPTTAGHSILAETFYDSLVTDINNGRTFVGTDTANTLVGFGGNDTLRGKGNDDSLIGNTGGDRLVGNRGDDILDGGLGNDHYIGGKGADQFVLRLGEGADVIRALRLRQGDQIILADGLTFGDLTIDRFRRKGARLSVDGEELAVVRSTSLSAINTADAFVEI